MTWATLPVLYCLWRDRKALLTNALLLGAYGLLAPYELLDEHDGHDGH
jgi:hypothetical protein